MPTSTIDTFDVTDAGTPVVWSTCLPTIPATDIRLSGTCWKALASSGMSGAKKIKDASWK